MSETCYINGRFLSQELTGVQRYAAELVKTLDAMIDAGEIDTASLSFVILAPRNLSRTLDLKHMELRRVGHLSGHLWEQVELPWHARNGQLINLCNAAPLMKRNQTVTIHDAGVFAIPGSYSRPFRIWYRFLLQVLGKISRLIMTDSEFSRSELTRLINVAPSKIRAIPLGHEHIAAALSDDYIIKRAGLNRRPFLLAVSSLSPRKNFQAVVRAVEKLERVDFDVVITGGSNPRVFADSGGQPLDHIRYLGYVTDGELKSLYSHAAAFIYPSLYEGFGLPPLEAMSCGCPVIVSDIPPHHEVCGEAALYCDPHDIMDIAKKISLIMNDGGLRRRLTESGRRRKQLFEWKDTAISFMSALEGDN